MLGAPFLCRWCQAHSQAQRVSFPITVGTPSPCFLPARNMHHSLSWKSHPPQCHLVPPTPCPKIRPDKTRIIIPRHSCHLSSCSALPSSQMMLGPFPGTMSVLSHHSRCSLPCSLPTRNMCHSLSWKSHPSQSRPVLPAISTLSLLPLYPGPLLILFTDTWVQVCMICDSTTILSILVAQVLHYYIRTSRIGTQVTCHFWVTLSHLLLSVSVDIVILTGDMWLAHLCPW